MEAVFATGLGIVVFIVFLVAVWWLIGKAEKRWPLPVNIILLCVLSMFAGYFIAQAVTDGALRYWLFFAFSALAAYGRWKNIQLLRRSPVYRSSESSIDNRA